MTLPPVRRLLAVVPAYVGVALLVVLGAAPVLAPSPAHAAVTRTIELTADGPKPATLTAAVGDTIVFKNTDQTFIHQVDEASPNWAFSCPPLAPNQTCTAGKLAKPGEYLYEGVNLDDFTGKVVVPGTASPAPAPSRASAAPAPSRSPAPAGSPAASPSPTGGSGSAGAPPLSGGFGSGGLPSLAPSPGGPAPAVAPVLPGEQASPAPEPTEQAVAVAPGRLPEPATARRYGLPAALAAVAAAGVGSLLVRLLLAHPAARARHGRLPGPPVTVD